VIPEQQAFKYLRFSEPWYRRFLIVLQLDPEEEGNTMLRNVPNYLPVDVTSDRRIRKYSKRFLLYVI